MADEKDIQGAVKDAARAGESTTRRAAETARDIAGEANRFGSAAAQQGTDTTRRAAETARDIAGGATRIGSAAAQQGADTVRKAAEAGAEMSRRGNDAVQDTSREMAGAATRIAGQTTEQIQRMFGFGANGHEGVAQQAQANMEAIVQCSSVLMDGMQSIWREWMGLSQEAMQRRVDGVNTILRSRSVPDIYAAQSDLVKGQLELLLNRSVRISELSAQTADDAARRLTERAKQATQDAKAA